MAGKNRQCSDKQVYQFGAMRIAIELIFSQLQISSFVRDILKG
jgi:hypothetical protein